MTISFALKDGSIMIGEIDELVDIDNFKTLSLNNVLMVQIQKFPDDVLRPVFVPIGAPIVSDPTNNTVFTRDEIRFILNKDNCKQITELYNDYQSSLSQIYGKIITPQGMIKF